MMSVRNPFQPHLPIDLSRFVGRGKQISTLENALDDLHNGSARHFMITGEQGIGKTSLLRYLRYMARGRVSVRGRKHKCLVIPINIRPKMTDFGLIDIIGTQLKRRLKDEQKVKALFSDFWEFLSRIRAFGVAIKEKTVAPIEAESALNHFSSYLAKAAIHLCDPNQRKLPFGGMLDGVVLLVDECDRASDGFDLGGTFKTMAEIFNSEECGYIMICLAGLPKLHTVMSRSHGSALRSFEEVSLVNLLPEEVAELIDVSLDYYHEKNEETVWIDRDAKDAIGLLSEGHPYYAQQLGYSAFAARERELISLESALIGALGSNESFRRIGDSHFRYLFVEHLKESHRDLVCGIAEKQKEWVTKRDIVASLQVAESDGLESLISDLKRQGLLIEKSRAPGSYRFVRRALGTWVKYFSGHCDDGVGPARIDFSNTKAPDDYYFQLVEIGHVLCTVSELLRRAEYLYTQKRYTEPEDLLMHGRELCVALAARYWPVPGVKKLINSRVCRRMVSYTLEFEGLSDKAGDS